jgi:hypothetical protein
VRAAALVVLCLVVIPAGVFAFATTQPAPQVSHASAIRQETAELKRLGYRYISCIRQGQSGAFLCQGRRPSQPGTTYYVLVGSDSR